MNKKVNITTEAGADAAAVNEAISAWIKLYRGQKKLSLDELSRRAGVSKGMLVEIEACKANPSIALLCRLAAAMGVSVADIVDVTSDPKVHILQPEQIALLWQGEHGGSARLLAGTSGPNMVELWRWELYPGDIFTSPGHPPETTELLHVTAGTLLLTVNGDAFTLEAGYSAVAATDTAHSYACAGDEPLIFTMTVHEKAR